MSLNWNLIHIGISLAWLAWIGRCKTKLIMRDHVKRELCTWYILVIQFYVVYGAIFDRKFATFFRKIATKSNPHIKRIRFLNWKMISMICFPELILCFLWIIIPQYTYDRKCFLKTINSLWKVNADVTFIHLV